MQQGVAVRHDLDRDARGFVFATLAASYRKPSSITNGDSYRAAVIAPVERALKDERIHVALLVLDGSPDDFVGWCATTEDALVFIYVKQAYRRRGFAMALLPKTLSRVVYQTPAGAHLQRARYGKPLRVAPYLLMEAV